MLEQTGCRPLHSWHVPTGLVPVVISSFVFVLSFRAERFLGVHLFVLCQWNPVAPFHLEENSRRLKLQPKLHETRVRPRRQRAGGEAAGVGPIA